VPYEPLVLPQGNHLLASLSREVFSLLEPALNEVSAPQGTLFLDAGEPIDQVYFPHSGMISLLVVTRDGDMVETSTVGREGAVGLHRGFGARRSFTRAIVQIPGRFLVVSARDFQELTLRSSDIREMISLYTEILWTEAQQIAACNAVHDASSRLCRWLLQSADRVESDLLPLTQEFLAQMLGVRRTTVTLLAQELHRTGAIKYSRGKITVLNRHHLEASACECYQVIRRQTYQ
jgi:CRP-like cAMP-binding protein